MRRYAAHVTKLVRAETQDRQHFGIDSVQRLAKPAGDQVIEFASASQATHHEFGDERALALAEAVQARRMEQCVGKRTIPLNASRQAVGARLAADAATNCNDTRRPLSIRCAVPGVC